MPNLDLSFIITVSITVCALITPLLTTLLNNKHQLKIKKLELKQQQYNEEIIYYKNIFENYIKYASKCCSFAEANELKDYGKSYLLAYMYAPNELQPEMSLINSEIRQYQWDKAILDLEALAPKLLQAMPR